MGAEPRAPRTRAPEFSLLIVACAAALAFFRLGDKGIWLDEASSAAFALGGPQTWFADHNQGLYYGLLGLWVGPFGLSEWALRAPSALLFCAASGMFYGLARELYGASIARIASVGFVLDATLVHFAQEARGYMLAVSCVVAGSWALARLLKRPRAHVAVLLAIAMTAGAYAHLFAVLVVAAQLLALFCFVLRRELPARYFVGVTALAGLGIGPLLFAALNTGGTQISWLYRPSVQNTWAALSFWLGGGPVLPWLAVLLAASWLARAHVRSLLKAPHLLVVLWCTLPPAIAYGVSFFFTPVVHPKYLLVVIPGILLAAARALHGIPSTRWRAVACAFWLVASMQRLYFWYADYEKEPWREAAALLLERVGPADAVLCDTPHADALDYYVTRSGRSLPRLVFPRRPWRFPSLDAPDERPLSGVETSYARIWLLENRDASALAQQLVKTHVRGQTFRFEPNDEDGASLFASSRGRIITVSAFTRKPR